MLEMGDMVTVACEDFKTMAGVIGIITATVFPSDDGKTGNETLYKVDFIGGRHLVPRDAPVWWSESDLEKIE